MLKVLIVDDEAIVRVGLKSMIDWEAHGFELVGEAKDGRSALEMIRTHHPDVMITDLKMPVVDGLELIRAINERQYQCRVVVLSSYDDFELVREAMKLGAVDYLLKLEVEPEQLIGVLESFRDDILKEKEVASRKAQLDDAIKTSLSAVRQALLRELVCCIPDPSQVQTNIERLGIVLEPSNMYCLTLWVGHGSDLGKRSAHEVSARITAIISVCEEVLCDNNVAYAFSNTDQEFVVLLSPKQGSASVSKLVQDCRRLVTMLGQYLGVSATIGVSERLSGWGAIPQGYTQAAACLKYRFCSSLGSIILWNQIESRPPLQESFSILPYRPRLEAAFAHRQAAELKDCLAEIRQAFADRCLTPEAACGAAVELYSVLCETIDRDHLSVDRVLRASQVSYQELLQTPNFQELVRWLEELQNDLLMFVRGKDAGYPWIIAEAKRFIHDHYDQEISLAEVAAHVGLTPSYFSTVFKDHLGISYSDYLTNLRIAKAKELLQTSSYRVYEISHLVGYPNHYYFNRLFKKVVGMTPLDYRRSKKTTN
jgi:two-component system response regulator YesN